MRVEQEREPGLRLLADILDQRLRIPGTQIRFGLDAILGLIPGLGDAAGGLLSSAIIFQAARLGASRLTLLRMVANVAIELIIGVVPFVGDIFDVVWRANVRNIRLLDASPLTARRSSAPAKRIAEAILLLFLLLLLSIASAFFGLLTLYRLIS